MSSSTESTRPLVERRLRYGWAAALLAGLTLAGMATPTHAGVVTFAQFDETGGNAPFSFTNTTTSATFSGTADGNFTLLIPGMPGTPQAATITLSSTTNAPAGSAGPFVDQPINGSTNTISFTRDSDGANLLTATFTGDLFGFDSDKSASLTGSTVTLTSSVLDLSGATTPGLAITVSNINPALSIGPGGFLNSFAADLSGGFTADAYPTVIQATPEPATLVSLGVCLSAPVAVRRKRPKAGPGA